MWSKLQRHKPYKSLKQLPIPKQLWNSISMDFIEKLLLFSGLAHLFVFHMFSKHSILSYIIFDKDLEFVSNFFHSLDTTLDIWLYFTLGYYFKGDGQTEHINQTLKQYLYIYCNYQQDNWSKLLSLAEFAYNNTLSATISVFPFFTNKGYHLNITIHPKCDIAFSQAHDFTIDLNKLQSTLKAEISVA